MKKYIRFGDDDTLTTRYDSVINTTIPNDAVEVDDALFFQTINETDGIWKIDRSTGAITKQPYPLPTIDHVKSDKLSEINAAAQADVTPYVNSYPNFEVDSWPQQAKEAAAYTADNTASTPWCDLAAAKRGIDRVAFIEKVQAKVQAYIQISATVAGYRQSLEDALDAIDLTVSDAATKIAAITYSSPLAKS